MPDQTIQINSGVLRWAARNMGWDLADLAGKVGIPAASIADPGSETCRIEAAKLKKIAKILGRPLAVLLLPEPPAESELADFRKLPNDQKRLSQKTYQAIRKARYWQSVSRELLGERHQRLPAPRRYRVDRDDPQKAASLERKKLGIGSGDYNIKNAYDLYNRLRNAIESGNVFVHQFRLPLREARGFTLPDGPPYVIVVNTADGYPARNFTLLHEYAHVLLQKEGICLPNLNAENSMSRQETEKWCNNFAGAFLMPEAEFLDQISGYQNGSGPSRTIQRLSTDFKVSKKAVMVRIMRLAPHTALARYCRTHYDEYAPQPFRESGGYADKVTLCKSQRGSKFIRLVLDSMEDRLISHGDVATYLGVDLKNLPELEERVYGIAA